MAIGRGRGEDRWKDGRQDGRTDVWKFIAVVITQDIGPFRLLPKKAL